MPATYNVRSADLYDIFGQTAYERYAQSTGGLNYAGLPMPTWYELPDKQKSAWKEAIAPLIPANATQVLQALNAPYGENPDQQEAARFSGN